jgi:hypothetical protein
MGKATRCRPGILMKTKRMKKKDRADEPPVVREPDED